jgi:hypothetical protein
MTWTQTIERYIAEGRTVSGGKGDSTAESTEKSQGAFTGTLQQVFASNNASQQAQLNFLNNKLQSAIQNPQGYSPSTLAAMRASATNQTAATNQNVQRQVQNMLATRGGAEALPSGVDAQIASTIASKSAQDLNQAQDDITMRNADLQNENQQRALSEELGVAQTENPEGFANAENQSAADVSNLSEAVTKAKGPGWSSILGGVVGAGLSGWASGGFKH